MTEKMVACCENCRFAGTRTVRKFSKTHEEHCCVRYPPVLVKPRLEGRDVFAGQAEQFDVPTVDPSFWCGEYQPPKGYVQN